MASSEHRRAARAPRHAVLATVAMATLLAALAGCDTASADSAPVSAAADAFLADQRAGAWLAAFGRLHTGMQQRCVSGEHLRERVEQAATQPVEWTLQPPQVRRFTAQVTGAVTGVDGRSNAVALSFDRVGDDWAITAWSSANREVCP